MKGAFSCTNTKLPERLSLLLHQGGMPSDGIFSEIHYLGREITFQIKSLPFFFFLVERSKMLKAYLFSSYCAVGVQGSTLDINK